MFPDLDFSLFKPGEDVTLVAVDDQQMGASEGLNNLPQLGAREELALTYAEGASNTSRNEAVASSIDFTSIILVYPLSGFLDIF